MYRLSLSFVRPTRVFFAVVDISKQSLFIKYFPVFSVTHWQYSSLPQYWKKETRCIVMRISLTYMTVEFLNFWLSEAWVPKNFDLSENYVLFFEEWHTSRKNKCIQMNFRRLFVRLHGHFGKKNSNSNSYETNFFCQMTFLAIPAYLLIFLF